MSNVTKIRVTIDDRPRDVIVGAFAQIAAKRRFGMDALRDGDPEPALYGVWIELDGPRPKGEDPEAFDRWLQTVERFDVVQPDEGDSDDEDPTPAESSGSSPFSPPTSD